MSGFPFDPALDEYRVFFLEEWMSDAIIFVTVLLVLAFSSGTLGAIFGLALGIEQERKRVRYRQENGQAAPQSDGSRCDP